MKIRPGRQEKLFLSHLAVVTILIFLATGSSQLADTATFALRVMTYPINLILNHSELIPAMPMEAIWNRPGIASALAAVVTPFLVINSYLWAFVICHIKWQWRPQESDRSEVLPPMKTESNRIGQPAEPLRSTRDLNHRALILP